tara:strand:- start:243 stop:725 length:483 start_codon:yes stop_codon:yes gene_type:complete
MKTVNNFLQQKDFFKIRNLLVLEPFFPYFISIDNKNSRDDDTFLLQHSFFENGEPNSKWFDSHIKIIIDYLDCKTLLRVRAVNYPINKEVQKTSFHTDFNIPHQTAILYLNTNNGYTEFENGDCCSCVANRILMFDGLKKHRAVTQTDTKLRTLVNINYI